MTENLAQADRLLGNLISLTVFSIPIFFVILGLWAQGFTISVDGTLQTFYLTRNALNLFAMQIALAAASLLLTITARLSKDIRNKGLLLFFSFLSYFFSIITLGYWFLQALKIL